MALRADTERSVGMIELYQFSISHYCEKIRWALDFKGLEYSAINLLPGFHIKTTTKLVGQSPVPVLVDGDRAIKGSSDIITYLEETYPAISLTPKDAKLKAEVLAWESYADTEIGPHVRCLCYHSLLEHPDIVIPFFAKGGPWYSKMILKLIFPKLQGKMRRFMKINEQAAHISKKCLDVAIDRIFEHRQKNEFMVGGAFSRADLAIAALLAPLCMPNGYGLIWPEKHPEPLGDSIASWGNKLDWVSEVYKAHR